MNLGPEYYDKNKVGRLISWGGDHTVYDYGADKVIKFSLVEFLMGKNGRLKVERDYLICKQFFGKFVLETEFKICPNGKYGASIQPKIIGHYLEKCDLDAPIINNQFREIMDAYYSLVASGNAKIDFVGRGGVFKSCMSNIFVTPDKQLVIIDVTLMESEGSGIFKPFFNFIFTLAHWRNNYIIKKFTK